MRPQVELFDPAILKLTYEASIKGQSIRCVTSLYFTIQCLKNLKISSAALYLVDMKPISSMFPKAVISLTGRVKNAYQFWLPSPPPYYQNLPLLGPPLFSNLEEDSYLIKTSPKYVRSVKVGCGRDVYLGNRVGRVKQRRAWHETLLHFCKTS